MICTGKLSGGKLYGSAEITYSNGDKYIGNLRDGLKSGSGKYTWQSGASYDGEWENDLMEGQGTYKYGSGSAGYMLTGTFKKGQPEGECTYYVSKDESYKTDWSSGKCVKIYE
jgi:hypothetical protein